MTTELRLGIENKNGKSEVTECYFTSPLKIGTPNSSGARRRIVLMMASAGILKGDNFSYDIWCKEGTKLLLTEQSYTKIFDTGEGSAAKKQHICLEPAASLIYRPSAVIPFAGSTYDCRTQIELSQTSELVYTDIFAAGRIGMGECLAFDHYRSYVCVELEGRPIWIDHCLLEPKTQDLQGMVYFDGYTHQGTFYYYGDKERQERLFEYLPAICQKEDGENTISYGVTHPYAGICIRVLANTAQDIEEVFDELTKYVEEAL